MNTYTFTSGSMDQDNNFTPDPSATTKEIEAADECDAFDRMAHYLEDFDNEYECFWGITNVSPKEED